VISTVVAALAGCATRTVGDSVCGRSIALTRMRYGHGLCQWLKGARIARVYAHRTRRTDRRCDRASSSSIQRTPWAISSAVNWSRSRRAGPRQCPSTIALGLSQARAVAGCHVGPRTQPRVPPAHSPNIRVTRLLAHSVTSVVANKVAIAAIPTRAVDAIAIDAMRVARGARPARASLRSDRCARRTPRVVVTRRHRISGAPLRERWRRISGTVA
jgi:hypothetical protein